MSQLKAPSARINFEQRYLRCTLSVLIVISCRDQKRDLRVTNNYKLKSKYPTQNAARSEDMMYAQLSRAKQLPMDCRIWPITSQIIHTRECDLTLSKSE